MSEFGKGIPLASGFDLGAKKPLDSRDVVDTIAERDAHVTENRAYEGMTVYVKEDKKVYRYDGQKWEDCTVKIEDLDLSDYYNKEEVDSKLENLDIDTEDCSYVGNDEPESEEVIWFADGTSSASSEMNYDNPLIQELFSCINLLQEQILELRKDVEYLKIHGGGGSSGGDEPIVPDKPNVDTGVTSLLLEDGGLFLLEDGGLLTLENSVQTISDSIMLLEDGSSLLLENGGLFILENTIQTINDSIMLLENGAKLLLENGSNIKLEK